MGLYMVSLFNNPERLMLMSVKRHIYGLIVHTIMSEYINVNVSYNCIAVLSTIFIADLTATKLIITNCLYLLTISLEL